MKTQNITNLGEHMWQVILNKHAKFYGDRTIGGAITVIIVKKSYGKLPGFAKKAFFIIDLVGYRLAK